MADILLSLGLDTRQLDTQLRQQATRIQQAGKVTTPMGATKGDTQFVVRNVDETTKAINKQAKAIKGAKDQQKKLRKKPESMG